jgi:two-component system chemotaxis sensor kinase CheA
MSQDPYRYFRVEARELLEQLGTGLLELERGPPAAELVPRLLRLAHTLKGAARVVKLPAIAEKAHALEDGLAPLRQEPRALGRERIDELLTLLDAMSALLEALAAPAAAAAPTAEAAGVEQDTAGAAEPLGPAHLETTGLNAEDLAALCAGMAEVRTRLGAMRRQMDSLGRARHLTALLAERLGQAANGERMAQRAASGTVEIPAAAAELRAVLGALDAALTTHLGQVEQELGQVGDMAERLALAPASRMLARLERVTRDLGHELGKTVCFEARGGDVRLDGHVLSVAEQALVQLVRNAVAHGIELAAERQAVGKRAEGRVVVEVVRRASRVSFSCHDDGRGVDLEPSAPWHAAEVCCGPRPSSTARRRWSSCCSEAGSAPRRR